MHASAVYADEVAPKIRQMIHYEFIVVYIVFHDTQYAVSE